MDTQYEQTPSTSTRTGCPWLQHLAANVFATTPEKHRTNRSLLIALHNGFITCVAALLPLMYLFDARRKFATKFLCVKTVGDKDVRHSLIGLTIRTKMIGGRDPFYLKIWVKLTA